MRMKIMPSLQISTIIHKTGLNIDKSDGGSLPLNGTVAAWFLFSCVTISPRALALNSIVL